MENTIENITRPAFFSTPRMPEREEEKMVMRANSDYLMRVTLKNPAIRLALGQFDELTTEGIIRHDADPVAGRLFAGGLASAALMTVLLGEQECYSIRISYKGPVSGMLIDARANGRVRGLVRNPHVMTAADSVEMACGDEGADVSVVRSLDGKVLNSGEVKTAFIMPSAALGYFLSVSDQVESEIRCEVVFQPDPAAPVRSADGVLMQAMPGCDLEEFGVLRQRLLEPPAGAILRDRASEPEEKLRALLMLLCRSAQPPEYSVTMVEPARFACNCSEKRMQEMARQMLGEEDFRKLLAEKPDPLIRCQFCGNEYHLKG